MDSHQQEFLKDLVDAPSPAGYEQMAQRIWRARVAVADRVTTDLHGNVTAVLNDGGWPRLMLAGHCDEIGFLVSSIDENGFLWFVPVGGHDPVIAPGQRVTIVTASGFVRGVIGRRPAHAMAPGDADKKIDLKDLWIDIGAKAAEQARALVALGDPVVIQASMEPLLGSLAVARAFDNKMGAYIVAETVRALSAQRPALRAAIFGVSTVQEEIGLRGAQTSAFGIDAQVGIAVDVTHATDNPALEGRKKHMGDIKVGGGPVLTRGANVNPIVFDLLVATAKAHDIPYQIEVEGHGTGTDGNVMQVTRAGMAIGVVSVALRYMHTPVEVLDTTDIDHTVRLLTQFALRLENTADFTPV